MKPFDVIKRPETAPGCYASAISYDDKAKECMDCIFRINCKILAFNSLTELNKVFGIKGKEVAKKDVALNKFMNILLNEKTFEQYCADFEKGLNPFSKKFVYLHVLFEIMAKRTNAVNAVRLSQLFFDVCHKTSLNKLGPIFELCLNALRRFGFVTDYEGRIGLKKRGANNADNNAA